jgi:preprotein translocase subunit SecG
MKIYKPDLNKRTLIRWKIYFDRSRMYIGYIQFFLIGTVFLQPFRDKPWADFIFRNAIISIPIAVLLFVILSLVLGYLDTKLGLREEEMRNQSKSNPVMMEMLEELKEIRKKLNEKGNDQKLSD